MEITYAWRGEFADPEVNALHAEGFGHETDDAAWWDQVNRHSLGWVTARDGGDLVGFVNVPWDGRWHAWVIDAMVATAHQRRGVGTALIENVTRHARSAGCEWLHVDFEHRYRGFYVDACGFTPAEAGLIHL